MPSRRRSRSRSRSPRRDHRRGSDHKRENPEPTNVLGVFGLSLRTREEDLERLFGKYGRLDKVTVVYDRRVSWFMVL